MFRPFMHVTIALLALQFGASAIAADLIVSAAASLTNAFTDIGREFERAHPDTKVVFNFAGSGQLLQQIAKGAPVDVFASADQETMDQAESQGLIETSSRFNFVRNALVVVVPIDSKLSLSSLEQLAKKEFRHIAIGNPDSVPVGRYSKSVLVAAGYWNACALARSIWRGFVERLNWAPFHRLTRWSSPTMGRSRSPHRGQQDERPNWQRPGRSVESTLCCLAPRRNPSCTIADPSAR